MNMQSFGRPGTKQDSIHKRRGQSVVRHDRLETRQSIDHPEIQSKCLIRPAKALDDAIRAFANVRGVKRADRIGRLPLPSML